MKKNSKCALCLSKKKPLSNSHLIPKAIYDWVKITSNTGNLRSTDNVNQRLQDGEYLPFLCPDCELYLSAKEKVFTSKLFKKIANYRQQAQGVTISQDMQTVILSMFWRVLSNHIHRENNRTKEDNTILASFLEQLRLQVKSNSPTEKIYFAPMVGEAPYYNLTKENKQHQIDLTYILDRAIGLVDVRFYDNPHRFLATLKLPFMYFYILSNDWDQAELKLSHELIIGNLDIKTINTIPQCLRYYINKSFDDFLDSKNNINSQSLRAIDKLIQNKTTKLTGSDKSYQRHLKI